MIVNCFNKPLTRLLVGTYIYIYIYILTHLPPVCSILNVVVLLLESYATYFPVFPGYSPGRFLSPYLRIGFFEDSYLYVGQRLRVIPWSFTALGLFGGLTVSLGALHSDLGRFGVSTGFVSLAFPGCWRPPVPSSLDLALTFFSVFVWRIRTMPSSPEGIHLYWGPGFPGLFLLKACQCCRLPVLLCLYHWLPKERSLVLPQAGYSLLVGPCPWLKLQQ
jgi:hypothetical protein